jgi:hypothetical protein
MKRVAVMAIACVVSWLVVTLVFAPGVAVELFLGMVAPLLVAATTMTLVERTYRRDPRRLTPLMIKAFGAKMLLFGAYVAMVLSLTPLEPIPFVTSFTVYFIGLHMTEAVWLRSVFADAVS